MRRLPRHAFPLSLATHDLALVREIPSGTASLLWIDRPFALTATAVLRELLERQEQDQHTQFLLGNLPLGDPRERLLCVDGPLASLHIEPEELDDIGDAVQFYSPLRWPPRPAEPDEILYVLGYPRDQWPAEIEFEFRVQNTHLHGFQADLLRSDMPGHMPGLVGAPVFRAGSPPELVGVVIESMFHNQWIRVRQANCLDACGKAHLHAMGE